MTTHFDNHVRRGGLGDYLIYGDFGRGEEVVAYVGMEQGRKEDRSVLCNEIADALVRRWNRGSDDLKIRKRVDGEVVGDQDIHLQVDPNPEFGLVTATLADMDDGGVVMLTEDSIVDLHRKLGKVIKEHDL